MQLQKHKHKQWFHEIASTTYNVTTAWVCTKSHNTAKAEQPQDYSLSNSESTVNPFILTSLHPLTLLILPSPKVKGLTYLFSVKARKRE